MQFASLSVQLKETASTGVKCRVYLQTDALTTTPVELSC
jgi:hypothetical protein